MKRVLVLVEGQTEEKFIKEVVQPHLWSKNISLEPKIVMTKRVIGGTAYKGGGDYTKIRADLRRLLGDSNALAVTSFFDFYGFPANIPNTEPGCAENIDALLAAIESDIEHPRFKAYLQRHEFEAFLFVDLQVTASVALQPEKAQVLQQQRNQFETVEDINLDPQLAPSKRLGAVLGSFSKPITGSLATQKIGIDRLRAGCPRFAAWLAWLESL